MKPYVNFSGPWELCAYSDAEYVRNNDTWKRFQDTFFYLTEYLLNVITGVRKGHYIGYISL